MSSFQFINTRQTSIYQNKSSKGHQGHQGARTQDSQEDTEGAELVQHLKEKVSGRDLIAVYNYLIGRYRQDELRLLWKMHSNRTRGNRHKPQQGNFNYVADYFYSSPPPRVIKHRNLLLREIKASPSLKIFRT